MFFNKYGPIREKTKLFFPCWNMNKATVVDLIKKNNICVPIDYEMFGRSFDGLDYRFIVQIKKRFPRDYKKIVEMFPLVEAEVFRYENI